MKALLLFLPLGFATAATPWRTADLVFRDSLQVTWLTDSSFWYRVKTAPKQEEFVFIDATTGSQRRATSLAELGIPPAEIRSSTLSPDPQHTARTGPACRLRLRNTLKEAVDLFWISPNGQPRSYGKLQPGEERLQPTFVGHVWRLEQAGQALATFSASSPEQVLVIDGPAPDGKVAPAPDKRPGKPSPDGRWRAVVGTDGVRLIDAQGSSRMLAKAGPWFGPVQWAPDSSAFVVSRTPPVPQRQITLVEAAPKDQLQPKVKTLNYTKPGDPLPNPKPVIFHTDGRQIEVDSSLSPNPFTQAKHVEVVWSPNSREFYFNYNQRGHQLYRILAANTATGAVRVVAEETSETFIHYSGKDWRHWLHDSGELLRMSERDGWCHLELHDIASGTMKRQVTRGSWPVREVLHVDETRREVWFLASGRRADEDPYHLHLCRVPLNGGDVIQLTEGDGNHRIEFSPNHEFFIARWSRADHEPVHELRRSRDGHRVCELERADIRALLAAGWPKPERFIAKGRDSQTDIHGVLIRPSKLDPAKKYPVVEEIYAGPHGAFAPKDFDPGRRLHEIAELGFTVVKLDGMGTNHRGKAFHDVCWKNLKDSGFPDRIAWIRAAAATRPWMDLTRVGIYGGSAGGQSAMRALLDHGDFYQVAVADCGCHDNRMDKIWWNEQWLGWPIDASYERNSNVADAAKLRGHLLLIVGELDSNVDPASTMQAVHALQKAGKDFEFQPIAGAGHGAAETPYGSKRRAEFLVRHLRP
jgi:dipeptidyl-peptidase-4